MGRKFKVFYDFLFVHDGPAGIWANKSSLVMMSFTILLLIHSVYVGLDFCLHFLLFIHNPPAGVEVIFCDFDG